MHAVVIGASMAGLTAARVLSDRYESVTVLDRDTLSLPAHGDGNDADPLGAERPRRGVPQGAQPHVLLVSGQRALESMFPGFADELTAAGAVAFDSGLGLCKFQYGRRWPQVSNGLDLVSASRAQFESVVRRRVAGLAAVTIRESMSVAGLTGDAERITGVVLDDGTTIDADLVVDASGRGSRSDRWLTELGCPAPEQVEVKIGITYTTRTYRRAPGETIDGWTAALIMPTPPAQHRAGVIVPIEGDRWMVMVGGWHVDAPPATVDEFDAFAASLPDPIVTNLVRTAEPLSDPVTFRFPASRRRDFDKLEKIPAGYVTAGDAFCSFNPIYGQGMTVATMQAQVLAGVLDHRGAASEAMARDYYRAAARIIATPWRFAVGGDFAFPQTTGPRPRSMAVTSWYARKISRASQLDTEINRAFFGVQQLVEPPAVLFKPRMVARVLRVSRRH